MGKVIVQDYTYKKPITMIGVEAGICWGANTSNDEKNYLRGIDCLESGHGRTFEFPEMTTTDQDLLEFGGLMKSKILNPKRMKQLIDFKGLELDNGIYPTDIDGLIEYHDSEYILLEVKHKDARVPYGQRLAIQRMVDDFTKAGKKAVAIVCEHKVDDTDKPVVAAFCKVRELYYGGEHKWRPPDSPMNVRQAIDKFRKYAKQHKGG